MIHKQTSFKVKKVFQATLKQVEQRTIIAKIAAFWKKDEKHDQSIALQRIIFILKMKSGVRSEDQSAYLQKHFEDSYNYIKQIKDKLDQTNYENLYSELTFEQFDECEVVFMQGDVGRKMYFILQGEVGILISNMKDDESPEHKNTPTNRSTNFEKILEPTIKTYEDVVKYNFPDLKLVAIKQSKDYFGEIAIEQRIPRTATVLTKTECSLAVLSFESYQKILGQYKDQILQIKLNFIQSIPLFNGWTKSALFIFLHACEEIDVSTKSIIYKRYQKSQNCYFIQKGEVIVEKWDKLPNSKVQKTKTLGDDDVSQIQSLITSNQDQKSTVGLYCGGQIFGDYEMQLYGYPKSVIRVSQATTTVDSKIFSIDFTQLYECFRMFSNISVLQEFEKDRFSQKVFPSTPKEMINILSSFKKSQAPKFMNELKYSINTTNHFTPNEGSIQQILYKQVDLKRQRQMRQNLSHDNFLSTSNSSRALAMIINVKQPYRFTIVEKKSKKHLFHNTLNQRSFLLLKVFVQFNLLVVQQINNLGRNIIVKNLSDVDISSPQVHNYFLDKKGVFQGSKQIRQLQSHKVSKINDTKQMYKFQIRNDKLDVF